MKDKETIWIFALAVAMIIILLVYIKITIEGGHIETYRWIITGGFAAWFTYNFYTRVKL